VGLVGGFVIAGLAAIFAVHQPVVAKADVQDGLAEAAEFFAVTRTLSLVALGATTFGGTGSGAHKGNVARTGGQEKMTLVIVAGWKELEQRLLPATRHFFVAYNPSNDLPTSAGWRGGSRPERGPRRQWCGIRFAAGQARNRVRRHARGNV